MSRKSRNQGGFTLLETMLALTIGAMIMGTLVGWSFVAMKSQGVVARTNMDGASVGFLRTTFLRDVASAHEAAVGSDLPLAVCGRGPGDGTPPSDPQNPAPGVPTPGVPPAAVQDGESTTTTTTVAPVDPGRIIPDDATPLFRLTDERGRRIVYATAESSRGRGVNDDKDRELNAAGEQRTSIWRYTCEGGQVLMSNELVADIMPGPAVASCQPRPAMPTDDCGIIRLVVTTVGGQTASMAATMRVDAEGAAGGGVTPPTFETPKVTIDVSPTEVHRGEPVTFNGSAFVDSGDPLTMSWDLGDGTTVDAATATHSYSQLGEYTAVFTATTPAGTPSTDFDRIDVINRKPVAVLASPANETTVNMCTDISFSGVGSNDSDDEAFGGHVTGYQWSFGDGTDATVTTPTTTHRFTQIASNSGTDQISASLAVQDNDGGVSQAVSTDLTLVNRPPTKPVITAQVGSGPVVSAGGTLPVTLPATVKLKANASDPDGECDELTYQWTLGNGETSTEQNPTLELTGGSSRTVKLKVTDRYGKSVTSEAITIQVNNPPVAKFKLSATKARTGDTVTVTNQSSDTETAAAGLFYEWTFEHAIQTSGATYSTSVQDPGTVRFSHDQSDPDVFAPGAAGKAYTVTLKVTDPQGASTTTTRTINITGAPAPTGLSASGKTASWSAVSAVSGYRIEIQERSCFILCWWDTATTHDVTSTSYTASKSPIRFKVRAKDSYTGKWGEWSETKEG